MTIPERSGRLSRNEKDTNPLVTPALSRATRRSPETVSKAATSSRSAKETLRMVLARLEDMKAEDSVTIDLTGKPSIGDYMVVTTGRSNVHVASIADSLVRALKAVAITGIHVEGLRQSDWVLIDAGGVIVHVFRPE